MRAEPVGCNDTKNKRADIGPQKMPADNGNVGIKRNNNYAHSKQNRQHFYKSKILYLLSISKIFCDSKQKNRHDQQFQMLPCAFIGGTENADNSVIS